MNITVYLASSTGNDPKFEAAVKELGTWIGASGNTLIYGGSKTGLMGELAQSVLQAGGKVIGVEPQFFVEEEYQYEGLTQLIVTKDMAERKTKMIELGDAFIAFPGGVGTLEEVSEICPSCLWDSCRRRAFIIILMVIMMISSTFCSR